MEVNKLIKKYEKRANIIRQNIEDYSGIKYSEFILAIPILQRELDEAELVLKIAKERNQLYDDLKALTKDSFPYICACDICSRPCGYDKGDTWRESCDDYEWRGLVDVQEDK